MSDLPPLMTAAVTTGHGGPEMLEIRHDWPRPTPSSAEALIRVQAAALNNTDIWTRTGAYGSDAPAGWTGSPLHFPRIQGGDIAGVVVEVGDGVDDTLLGRRVVVDPAAEYDEHDHPSRIVGSEVDGGFAQFHVSPAVRLHDVTDSPLSDQQLACLPIAYATALGMIEEAGCRPGERVLTTGASGGVGLAAIQILAARGCHAIACTSTGKEAAIREAGAVEVMVRGRDPLSKIDEVDAVLDVVGGPEFGELVDRLRTGGRLVTVGAIAGPLVELDLRRVYLRHRRVLGSTMHSPTVFAAVVDMARLGAVAPVVAETYPLTDIATAQEHFADHDFVGKLVIVPT